MDFAAVVVTWNGEPWIEECLESLRRSDLCRQVVVVDNDSSDGTLQRVEGIRQDLEAGGMAVHVISLPSNEGFTCGANRGLESIIDDHLQPDAILLLNQDAFLEEDCLRSFEQAFQRHPRGGAFGPKILFPAEDTIQHAGAFLEHPRMTGRHFGHHESADLANFNQETEVEFVTGAAIAIRTAALVDVGFLNEVFSPGYYEDVEFCNRLQSANWSVHYIPTAMARHHESTAFGMGAERLRLVNRNRFIYVLPYLHETGFADLFVEAEARFLREGAVVEEVRAVSSGALWVLAHLPDVLRLRESNHDQRQDNIEDLIRIFSTIRLICLETLVSFLPTRQSETDCGKSQFLPLI